MLIFICMNTQKYGNRKKKTFIIALGWNHLFWYHNSLFLIAFVFDPSIFKDFGFFPKWNLPMKFILKKLISEYSLQALRNVTKSLMLYLKRNCVSSSDSYITRLLPHHYGNKDKVRCSNSSFNLCPHIINRLFNYSCTYLNIQYIFFFYFLLHIVATIKLLPLVGFSHNHIMWHTQLMYQKVSNQWKKTCLGNKWFTVD